MALLYERYGAAMDIEEKPEWTEVQELQRGWLAELEEKTGSDQEMLFEKTQTAIGQVLGATNDVAISLSLGQAVEIVQTAVNLVLTTEVQAAQASGSIN